MRQTIVILLLLNLLFVAVAWPQAWGGRLPLFAAEALLLTGLFLLLPAGAWRAIPAYLIGVLYVAAALIAGFDILVRTSLGRALNLYLDFPLLRSAYDLSLTNLGVVATVLIALGGALAISGLTFVLGRLLAGLHARSGTARWAGSGLLILGLIAAGAAGAGRGPVAAEGIGSLHDQWRQAQQTRQEQRDFARTLATEAARAEPTVLPGLAGRDVYLVFVESYGMEAMVDPEYAPAIRSHLAAIEQQLDSAGIQALTGRLTAPIQGGQSWLAHGTLLSGEWLPNQVLYETMLDSGKPTLVTDFSATDHQTHAVMPANTRDWPVGDQYGFDSIHDARTMGYAGPAMNFFTMPDQYTLSWLHHGLRQRAEGPLFAAVALISSHAPWVPVLPIVDWDQVDDGQLFHQHAGGHPSPDEVFQDNARVREYYLDSIEYSLQVVADYAERYLPEDALLIAIGDHEAPPIVTSTEVNRAVPVHLISQDEGLLDAWAHWLQADAFAQTLVDGFWPGTEQAPAAPAMNAFRQSLHRVYGDSD